MKIRLQHNIQNETKSAAINFNGRLIFTPTVTHRVLTCQPSWGSGADPPVVFLEISDNLLTIYSSVIERKVSQDIKG